MIFLKVLFEKELLISAGLDNFRLWHIHTGVMLRNGVGYTGPPTPNIDLSLDSKGNFLLLSGGMRVVKYSWSCIPTSELARKKSIIRSINSVLTPSCFIDQTLDCLDIFGDYLNIESAAHNASLDNVGDEPHSKISESVVSMHIRDPDFSDCKSFTIKVYDKYSEELLYIIDYEQYSHLLSLKTEILLAGKRFAILANRFTFDPTGSIELCLYDNKTGLISTKKKLNVGSRVANICISSYFSKLLDSLPPESVLNSLQDFSAQRHFPSDAPACLDVSTENYNPPSGFVSSGSPNVNGELEHMESADSIISLDSKSSLISDNVPISFDTKIVSSLQRQNRFASQKFNHTDEKFIQNLGKNSDSYQHSTGLKNQVLLFGTSSSKLFVVLGNQMPKKAVSPDKAKND